MKKARNYLNMILYSTLLKALLSHSNSEFISNGTDKMDIFVTDYQFSSPFDRDSIFSRTQGKTLLFHGI